MKQVAKLIIIDNKNMYLMMRRSDHPTFGLDSDLPGGTLEEGEQPMQTMLREVFEEAGAMIDQSMVKQLYSGSEYSAHGTHYSLFVTRLAERPAITISWEHSSYEWLSRDEFLKAAKSAKDTYMHMVYEVISVGNIEV